MHQHFINSDNIYFYRMCYHDFCLFKDRFWYVKGHPQNSRKFNLAPKIPENLTSPSKFSKISPHPKNSRKFNLTRKFSKIYPHSRNSREFNLTPKITLENLPLARNSRKCILILNILENLPPISP